MLLGKVSISEGHGQGLVTEYLLHVLQACASHDHLAGKGMSSQVMEPEIIETGPNQGLLEWGLGGRILPSRSVL